MTLPAELREQLSAALAELTLAEQALELALSELSSRPRAEKVTVTLVVTDAFSRVRAAHECLRVIRQALDD